MQPFVPSQQLSSVQHSLWLQHWLSSQQFSVAQHASWLQHSGAGSQQFCSIGSGAEQL
ncbi:hypothetical protein [Paraferrimonas sp. SM1919]|uniref:hypothetical protein n=1 Tax=Paraferrimonas sp. SM1919 TaxID=2662263 RepID=UPI0013D7D6AB|nr:hypothetical protein [Paraferrimonas sp. SM1919]